MSNRQERADTAEPIPARGPGPESGINDEFTAPANVQNPEEGKAGEVQNPEHAGEQTGENRQPPMPEANQPEYRDNQNENMGGFSGNNPGAQAQQYTQAQERE